MSNPIQAIIVLQKRISQYKRLIKEIYNHRTDEGQCDCHLCVYHKLEIESSPKDD